MSHRAVLTSALALFALAVSVTLLFWSPLATLCAALAALAGGGAGRLSATDGKPKTITEEAGDGEARAARAREEEPAPLSGAGAKKLAGALLEVTMDSMREGIVVVDGSMRIMASNQAAHEIFGGGGGAPTSRLLSELTRDPRIHEAFAAAVERGARAEVKVESREADPRHFDVHVAPLRRPDVSNVQGAVGVFFDITRLERLERVRQEFLSNVSHELRTPLTAILTYIETLEDGAAGDPETTRRFLAVIRRNSERMHNLINDILELSDIEAGTATIEKARLRLSPLVNEVAASLASRAAARQIAVRNEIAHDAYVFADARRLEQMLTNLVDNAIKFGPEGSKVTIGHRWDGRDRIMVTDTGEGIPAEHVRRIFERFYRVDRARSRALGGTGLGLAIVKHLARAHGGEVSVHSAVGEGSTFVIELPGGEPEEQ